MVSSAIIPSAVALRGIGSKSLLRIALLNQKPSCCCIPETAVAEDGVAMDIQLEVRIAGPGRELDVHKRENYPLLDNMTICATVEARGNGIRRLAPRVISQTVTDTPLAI